MAKRTYLRGAKVDANNVILVKKQTTKISN